jgi:hypothetical protein
MLRLHRKKQRSYFISLLCGLLFLAAIVELYNHDFLFADAQDTSTCLSNPEFNQVFVDFNGGASIPTEGSCCQKDVCNLPCPATTPSPGPGYGIAVGVVIFISFAFGLLTYFWVGNKSENYFVAGHAIPTWVVCMTLGAQAVDSNSLLGNVDLAYKFSFWDGAGTSLQSLNLCNI